MADNLPALFTAAMIPDPVTKRPLTCIGRSTGAVCEGAMIAWGIHSAWRADGYLFLAVLAQNRTPEIRGMLSRGLTVVDQRGLQYEAKGDCHYTLRPTHWTPEADIYPGAIARVWAVVPWEPEAEPRLLIWSVGQTRTPIDVAGFPGVASRGGERLMAAWADLVRPDGGES